MVPIFCLIIFIFVIEIRLKRELTHVGNEFRAFRKEILSNRKQIENNKEHILINQKNIEENKEKISKING